MCADTFGLLWACDEVLVSLNDFGLDEIIIRCWKFIIYLMKGKCGSLYWMMPGKTVEALA